LQLVVGVGHVEQHARGFHALTLGLHQAGKALQLVELGAHAQSAQAQQPVEAGIETLLGSGGGAGMRGSGASR
jgi:hypothetical protein